MARLLGVPEGTMVPRRHRVTGPVTEPPFQISDSWIHPGVAKEVPEVRQQDPVSMWVLEIVRMGRSGTTLKPVEVTAYVIPADRIETVQVLERDEAAKDPWPD